MMPCKSLTKEFGPNTTHNKKLKIDGLLAKRISRRSQKTCPRFTHTQENTEADALKSLIDRAYSKVRTRLLEKELKWLTTASRNGRTTKPKTGVILSNTSSFCHNSRSPPSKKLWNSKRAKPNLARARLCLSDGEPKGTLQECADFKL